MTDAISVKPLDKKAKQQIETSITDLADESGWAFLGEVGKLILKKEPDFDPRNYGFKKLGQLIKSIPEFEIDERQTDKSNIKLIYIRVKPVNKNQKCRTKNLQEEIMMRNFFLLTTLAILAVVSGMLLADASWIGRVGMTFFYKEYNLLKIWWQGAAAVYLLFVLLFLIHTFIQTSFGNGIAKVLHFVMLFISTALLYFTYDDFQTDFSHRLLGWRFHSGFYLCWIGWIIICVFFLFKKKKSALAISPDNTDAEDI